jgi:transcriptional regulator with XRE-family HTH domain
MDYAAEPMSKDIDERVPEAAVLLREARKHAGLTQRQLGARLQVTQALVSDYERGRRQPTLRTLSRLIEATGCRLRVEVDTLEDASDPS